MLPTVSRAGPDKPKTNVSVDEYSRLREMIVREQVMPNERLVEQDYAERFGTNRSNIRKALARLEQDGLVVLEPFRGARVRRITASEAVEMFEVRGALEVMLMDHVVERITEPDKKALRTLLQRLCDAARANDATAVGLASRRLREELWRISGHSTSTKLLAGLNTHVVRTWYQIRTIPGRADAIAAQLSAVIDAVCAPSTERAATAMRQYHDAAITNLRRALSMATGDGER